jgi:hypothetical protein
MRAPPPHTVKEFTDYPGDGQNDIYFKEKDRLLSVIKMFLSNKIFLNSVQ